MPRFRERVPKRASLSAAEQSCTKEKHSPHIRIFSRKARETCRVRSRKTSTSFAGTESKWPETGRPPGAKRPFAGRESSRVSRIIHTASWLLTSRLFAFLNLRNSLISPTPTWRPRNNSLLLAYSARVFRTYLAARPFYRFALIFMRHAHTQRETYAHCTRLASGLREIANVPH